MWISSRSIVAAAGTLGLLQASLTSAQASNVTSTVVPNVYIVELANTGVSVAFYPQNIAGKPVNNCPGQHPRYFSHCCNQQYKHPLGIPVPLQLYVNGF